jgi:hypothetical protein
MIGLRFETDNLHILDLAPLRNAYFVDPQKNIEPTT